MADQRQLLILQPKTVILPVQIKPLQTVQRNLSLNKKKNSVIFLDKHLSFNCFQTKNDNHSFNMVFTLTSLTISFTSRHPRIQTFIQHQNIKSNSLVYYCVDDPKE